MDKSLILDFGWQIITTIIFSIIWLIRLEAKVIYLDKSYELLKKYTEKEIDLLTDKQENFERDIRDKLSEIIRTLSLIQGKLSIEIKKGE